MRPINANPNAMILGNILSKLGTWLNFMAVLLLVQQHYESALSLSIIIICKRLPSVLFSYAGGKLADFWNVKKLIVGLNLFFCALVFCLWYLPTDKNNYLIPLMIIYSLISLTEGMYKPALRALNYQAHHSQLNFTKINSLLSSTGMLTVIVSNMLSVFLFDLFGLKLLLQINIVIYILATLSFLSVKVLSKVAESKDRTTNQNSFLTKEIKFYLGVNSCLSIMFSYIGLVTTKFPFEVYFNGEFGTGLINLFIGLSIVSASIFHRRQKRTLHIREVEKIHFIYALIFMAFFNMIFSHISVFNFACIFLFTSMAIFSYCRINIEDLLQVISPSYKIGRIFSINFILQEIIISLSFIMFGIGADFWSLEVVGKFYSILFFILIIIYALSLVLRKGYLNPFTAIKDYLEFANNKAGVNK